MTEAVGSARGISIWDHPRGLWWIGACEFWERFSYYGMQSLLVLYMTHQLLQPGHVENVLGFGGFRHLLEQFYGPLSAQALASVIFGLYAGLVYLTPIAGGWIADRLLGRTLTVTLGATLMACGHFLMAFDASFLLALACLLTGSGCFKGNLAAQIATLYPPDDRRVASAYQIYTLIVQIAVIFAPLVCGTLGETAGWHWGFGVAGVGMLLGLSIYLYARRHLPPETRRRAAAGQAPVRLSAHDRRSLLFLFALVPPLAMLMAYNMQIFNAYLVWAESSLQRHVLGYEFPVTWLISLDAAVSTAAIPVSLMFWRWWSRRWTEPDEVTKITCAGLFASLAPMCLVVGVLITPGDGARVSIVWALAAEVINDLAFSNIYPVALALFSRAAPRNLSGVMVAVFFTHLFLSNMLVGRLGGMLEHMAPVSFWLMHAAIVLTAAIVFAVFRRTLIRQFYPAAQAA